MKRWTYSLATVLLLCGCTEPTPPVQPEPPVDNPPVATVESEPDPAALERLSAADPQLRRRAVEQLRRDDPARLGELLGQIAAEADHPEGSRLFALEQARVLGRAEPVKHLVPLVVDGTGGALREPLERTLVELTGRRFETAEAWQQWWRANRAAPREQWLQDALHQLRATRDEQARQIQKLNRRLADMLVNELRRNLQQLAENGNDDRDRLELFERALAKPLEPVRIFALNEIGNRKPKGALPLVVPYLEHEDAVIRAAAVKAFAELKPPRASERLVELLDDEAWQVCLAALEGLSINPAAEARPSIERHLTDPSVEVAWKAAQVLGELGDARAVKALVGALGHPEEKVRWWSAYSLGQLGSPDAVKPLVEAYDDAFPGVREAIVRALGTIGSPEAVPLLKKVMADAKQPEKLRKVAWQALVQVLGGNFELALAEIESNVEAARLSRAIELFEHVVETMQDRADLKPRLFKLRLDFVDHYLKAGQADKALALVRLLASEDRQLSNPVLQLKRLALEIDRDQLDAARSLVEQLVEKRPTVMAGRFELALALARQYIKRGRLRRARRFVSGLKALEEHLSDKDAEARRTMLQDIDTRLEKVARTDRERFARLLDNQGDDSAKLVESLRQLDDKVVAEALVELLDNNNPERRQLAIDLLKQLYGVADGFGYDPKMAAPQRNEAVGRWRKWFDERTWD